MYKKLQLTIYISMRKDCGIFENGVIMMYTNNFA